MSVIELKFPPVKLLETVCVGVGGSRGIGGEFGVIELSRVITSLIVNLVASFELNGLTIEKSNLGTSSRNFVTLAKLVATAALWREESRGGHFRTDFPERNDELWQVHSIQKLGAEISSSGKINFEKNTEW